MKMNMLLSIMLTAVLLLISGTTYAARSPVVILVAPDQGAADINSGVVINIYLKNTSDGDITILKNKYGVADADYTVRIWYRDGVPVPYTKYGRCIADGLCQTGSGRLLTMTPGQQISDKINVSKMYDIRAGGDYLVQALWGVPKKNGGDVVASDVIMLHVAD